MFAVQIAIRLLLVSDGRRSCVSECLIARVGATKLDKLCAFAFDIEATVKAMMNIAFITD